MAQRRASEQIVSQLERGHVLHRVIIGRCAKHLPGVGDDDHGHPSERTNAARTSGPR
jgi:hypothetical protein